MRQRLLIDAQAIAWASQYKLPDMKTPAGQLTGGVFGFLRTIEFLARELEPEEMIICWDRRCHKRFEIYPAYKEHRQFENIDKDAQEFRTRVLSQIEELKHLLKLLPVIQIEEEGAEADDTIGVLSKFMRLEDVGIVSRDKDLYQLVTDNCHIVGTDAKRVDLEFKPQQYLTYKVLDGDTSDHIGGVPNVGDKTVRKLIREYGTLKAIMAHVKEVGKLGKATYEEALAIVKRNKQLMIPGLLLTDQQRTSVIDQYRQKRTERTIADKREIRLAFKHYSFASLISRQSSYTMCFQSQIRVKHGAQPEAKKWKPPADHPAHSTRALRSKDRRTMRPTTRIVRKTLPRTGQHARYRRQGFARIVRRTVSDADESAGPALLADESQPLDAGGASRIPNGKRKSRTARQQAANVGQSGASRQVADRDGKAGAAAEGNTDRATEHERERRHETLNKLSTLGRDTSWVEKRSVRTLKFVTQMIDRFTGDPLYVPSTQEAAWVSELHDDYTWELPSWMGEAPNE